MIPGASPLAIRLAAFTVSVAVSPEFTDRGETEQLGSGVGPLTEHDNEIAPWNPPCAVNVSTSVARLPRFMLRLVEAGVIEKSKRGLNVADTDRSEVKVTRQALASGPLQAPVQLAKVEPGAGLATSEICVAAPNRDVQAVPQEMPGGVLLTVPVPAPVFVTASRKTDLAAFKSTTTELSEVRGTTKSANPSPLKSAARTPPGFPPTTTCVVPWKVPSPFPRTIRTAPVTPSQEVSAKSRFPSLSKSATPKVVVLL